MSPEDEELDGTRAASEISESETALPPTVTTGEARRLDPGLPEMIAGYRILGRLGEGGMGVVYEAEQQSPRRRVAVKVVRGGRFVNEHDVRMFQREADSLARLKHRNIAAIHESGCTEDGQHFFAMELVQGSSLKAYLWQRPETLSPDEMDLRLELVAKIADAVHYAHQKGVIHRDLKPSNVFVTEETTGKDGMPEIKILDFGLARITDTDVASTTMKTEVGVIKGTLPYMSPEQARGNPEEIDVRTDVYALGVILYEMLTGRRPHDMGQTSLAEAVRIICEEPARPLREVWRGARRLDQDIETIVETALEKDAERRYASAKALAEDIGRYMAAQPITARPPSTAYQLKKLIQRHTAGFVFVVSSLLLLVAFAVGISVLLARTLRAESRASREATTSRQVSDFMVDLFKVSNPGEARGNTITAREILDEGARRVEHELQDQPAVQARFMRTVGDVYLNLGLYREARSLLETSLTIGDDHLGQNHVEVAESALSLGRAMTLLGELDDAQSMYERAVTIFEGGLGSDSPNTAQALNHLGLLQMRAANYPDAERLLRRALEIQERALGPGDEELAWTLNNLALLSRKMGDNDAARTHYERALSIKEEALGPDHPSVATGLNNLASLHSLLGDYSTARSLFDRALTIRRKVLGPDHVDVGHTLNNLGELLRKTGDHEAALPMYAQAQEVFEKAFGPNHTSVAMALNNQAILHQETGRLEQARALYERAVQIFENALGPNHPNVAVLQNNLGDLLRKMGDFEGARVRLERALAIIVEVAGPNHLNVASVCQSLADARKAAGDFEAAGELYERALGIREAKLDPGHADIAETLEAYADLLRKVGDPDRSAVLDTRAREIRDSG